MQIITKKQSPVIGQNSKRISSTRGDYMKDNQEYAATYKFGNSTVHIVAPPPMTEKEKENILRGFYKKAWDIIYEAVERGEEV